MLFGLLCQWFCLSWSCSLLLRPGWTVDNGRICLDYISGIILILSIVPLFFNIDVLLKVVWLFWKRMFSLVLNDQRMFFYFWGAQLQSGDEKRRKFSTKNYVAICYIFWPAFGCCTPNAGALNLSKFFKTVCRFIPMLRFFLMQSFFLNSL